MSLFTFLFLFLSLWAAFPFTTPVLVSQLERGELLRGLDPCEPLGSGAVKGVCQGEHKNLPSAFFA